MSCGARVYFAWQLDGNYPQNRNRKPHHRDRKFAGKIIFMEVKINKPETAKPAGKCIMGIDMYRCVCVCGWLCLFCFVFLYTGIHRTCILRGYWSKKKQNNKYRIYIYITNWKLETPACCLYALRVKLFVDICYIKREYNLILYKRVKP